MRPATDAVEIQRRYRFIMNGGFATAVHFVLLVVGLELLGLQSAGMANLFAACGGVAASFMGNRWFVFRAHDAAVLEQAARFFPLYGTIALAHGTVLWVWTDFGGLDYRLGFVMATAGQVAVSYLGNKRLVFK